MCTVWLCFGGQRQWALPALSCLFCGKSDARLECYQPHIPYQLQTWITVVGTIQHELQNRGALFPITFASFMPMVTPRRQVYTSWLPQASVTSAWGSPAFLTFNCLDRIQRTGVNQVLTPALSWHLYFCCSWCSSTRARFSPILFAWGFRSSTAILLSRIGKCINID